MFKPILKKRLTMKLSLTKFSLFCVVCFSVALVTAGQSVIQTSVFSNGGRLMSGENHKLIGTVGQPFIGNTTSSEHTSSAGFWYLRKGVVTSVDAEDNDIKLDFNLAQNYPNPFNPNTVIKYTIAKKTAVRITVYNSLGERVAQLVNDEKTPGKYNIDFNASSLASGAYFYRIATNEFTSAKKMLLIK